MSMTPSKFEKFRRPKIQTVVSKAGRSLRLVRQPINSLDSVGKNKVTGRDGLPPSSALDGSVEPAVWSDEHPD